MIRVNSYQEQWIGWKFRHQYDYDRLKLIANNSRFLILPDWHYRNLGSKILCLCRKRLCAALRSVGSSLKAPKASLRKSAGSTKIAAWSSTACA
jgi:hypothetical protein